MKKKACLVRTLTVDSDTACEDTDQPKKLNQAQLSDLVRDLELSRRKSELLASRLKERNLLNKRVKNNGFSRERCGICTIL